MAPTMAAFLNLALDFVPAGVNRRGSQAHAKDGPCAEGLNPDHGGGAKRTPQEQEEEDHRRENHHPGEEHLEKTIYFLLIYGELNRRSVEFVTMAPKKSSERNPKVVFFNLLSCCWRSWHAHRGTIQVEVTTSK